MLEPMEGPYAGLDSCSHIECEQSEVESSSIKDLIVPVV